jgi:methyltransferase (TIGR00027 family)
MTEKGASWTARWVAMARGLHLLIDNDPKILEDTLGQALADFPDDDPGGINDPVWADREKVGIRTHVIWRSRITEDRLQSSVQKGVHQYVMLGAGLDSFACRRPASLEHVAVFEIDHPASQAWKRQKLRELGITIPENVHFVPVDFETENLVEKLKQSAFDPGLPTFFSWLGVIPYLTRKATQETLHAVLATVGGYCELTLDFVIPSETLSELDREQMENARKATEDAGEPSRGLYHPD